MMKFIINKLERYLSTTQVTEYRSSSSVCVPPMFVGALRVDTVGEVTLDLRKAYFAVVNTMKNKDCTTSPTVSIATQPPTTSPSPSPIPPVPVPSPPALGCMRELIALLLELQVVWLPLESPQN